MFSVHTVPEEFENGGFTLKRIKCFPFTLLRRNLKTEVSLDCDTRHQIFSVHTTPDEFKNGGFTLKTHQMFFIHTTQEEFKNGGFTLKTHQMFSVHTLLLEFENRGFTLKRIKYLLSTLRRGNLKTEVSL